MDVAQNPITLVTHIDPDTIPVDVEERQGALTVLIGSQMGATFALTGDRTLIGRAREAGIVLDDESISRHHARIHRNGKHYEIEDLGSRNGTCAAGARVHGRARLSEGCRVQIANVVMRFSMQDSLEAAASRNIYEQSVRDGLTGVHNRRYFDERITGEFAYAVRHGSPLCVILIDIDHFKQVNDRLGHHGGDAVLRKVAAALQSSVRAEDVLARYGGEEFVVIARGIDLAGARLFAERMRNVIERMDVSFDGKPITVTISLGVAHNHSGAAVANEDALVASADAALYGAKHAGRNRTQFAVSPGRYTGIEVEPAKVVRKRVWEQPTAPELAPRRRDTQSLRKH